MHIVKVNDGIPGITGVILVWRERGTYYIGRTERAFPITFQFLIENYRQEDGSPIDIDKIPEEWPGISNQERVSDEWFRRLLENKTPNPTRTPALVARVSGGLFLLYTPHSISHHKSISTQGIFSP